MSFPTVAMLLFDIVLLQQLQLCNLELQLGQYAAFGDGTALFRVRSSRFVKTIEAKCAKRVFAEACATQSPLSRTMYWHLLAYRAQATHTQTEQAALMRAKGSTVTSGAM